MENHVHLLVSADKAGAASSAMRLSGQSYVQSFNVRHRRSGMLWQGRFKSCLVQTERYVLAALRYIELNPVRARLVALPTEYRWSSVQTHLAHATSRLIMPHEVYLHLGCDAVQRVSAYASGFMRV
uniref:transposase n=1 Tax=Xanthomonas sp. 0924 TaxID=2835534 RepID=UPI003F82067C